MCPLYAAKKKILVQVDTVTVRGKFVSMTSRTRGVDETCECEKVTIAAPFTRPKTTL